MKLLFVCVLLVVISVCQSDARGIKDETDQHSCFDICHEKYPNGEKGLIALCIRVCRTERGVVTVNPTGLPENPTGVEAERNRQCFIACHNKYMDGPQALLDRCNRLCENPTGVEAETSPNRQCFIACHDKYMDGPQALLDRCNRLCENPTGVKEERNRQCFVTCHNEYSNGPKVLLDRCNRLCENPTGVKEETSPNRRCFVACQIKFPFGPKALLDHCDRKCENPTGVKEEISPCWDQCHIQYPHGPPGLVDYCIRRCDWGNGLAENSVVPEYVIQYVKDEFHLDNTLPDTRTCPEICREKYPMAGPIVLKVCIDICDMAKGTTPPPDFTVKPITNSPVIAHGSDKECKLINM